MMRTHAHSYSTQHSFVHIKFRLAVGQWGMPDPNISNSTWGVGAGRWLHGARRPHRRARASPVRLGGLSATGRRPAGRARRRACRSDDGLLAERRTLAAGHAEHADAAFWWAGAGGDGSAGHAGHAADGRDDAAQRGAAGAGRDRPGAFAAQRAVLPAGRPRATRSAPPTWRARGADSDAGRGRSCGCSRPLQPLRSLASCTDRSVQPTRPRGPRGSAGRRAAPGRPRRAPCGGRPPSPRASRAHGARTRGR